MAQVRGTKIGGRCYVVCILGIGMCVSTIADGASGTSNGHIQAVILCTSVAAMTVLRDE
jgi:hypothetical protein